MKSKKCRHRLFPAVVFGISLGLSASICADPLPVPCGGGSCGGRVWVTEDFTRAPQVVGNSLLVRQIKDREIFNWKSFDIDSGHSVEFRQPSERAIALNRIFDNDASRIFGRITANGQVMLYNQNGILFGRGSQINVGSLTATTLDVSDEIFKDIGILRAVRQTSPQAAFQAAGPMGSIRVEEGASLKSTAAQGRIMLLAPEVVNEGTIETPDGQTVLAASHDTVYLEASDDPGSRGILVEVGTGGDVSNLGSIIAERGNATLLGLAVNQSGLVRATTSVRANGSIRLLARDGASVRQLNGQTELFASHTGDLVFGEGSVTEVTPELADSNLAIDKQEAESSLVEGVGKTIELQTGALIRAPAGVVALSAVENPDPTIAVDPKTSRNDSRIRIAAGAIIDVSGTTSAVLPASRNLIEVELRGDELRDAPLQRNGPLRNKTIVVDVRKGTPLADISSALNTIERSVGERNATGGRISLRSEGDVLVNSGATLDVSGGFVTYDEGNIETSKLLTSNGHLVDISKADPAIRYERIANSVTVKSAKWGTSKTFSIFGPVPLTQFSPSYREGKDAGALNVVANGRTLLEGNLIGSRTRGPFQRELPGSLAGPGFTRPAVQIPRGGQLLLGAPDQIGELSANLQAPDVLFQTGPIAATIAAGEGRADDAPLTLSTDWFGLDRFSELHIYSNGLIKVPQATRLDLGAGGELEMVGNAVQIDGGIIAASGNISAKTLATRTAGEADAIELGTGARLDVAGQWVNDNPLVEGFDPTSPLAIDGGRISLDGRGQQFLPDDGGVRLSADSRIDVSGGAWLSARGQLVAGKGGRINIAATDGSVLDADLEGFALKSGGELSISIPEAVIGATGAPPGSFVFDPAFFGRGGFGRFALTSDQGSLTVLPDTVIKPTQKNFILDPLFSFRPSTSSLAGTSQPGVLDPLLRNPVDLSLTVAPTLVAQIPSAKLEIGSGAELLLEPEGKLSLRSVGSLLVDGTLTAPGGEIDLAVTTPDGDNDPFFLRNQVLWLGPNAHLSTNGVAEILANDQGIRSGRVVSGGDISLVANRGYLVTDANSLIETNGVSATVERIIDVTGASRSADIFGRSQESEAVQLVRETVHAPAGSIRLQSAEGVFLEGKLSAQAADTAGARGGRLTLSIAPRLRNAILGFPGGPVEIVVSADTASTLPDDFAPTDDIADELNGKAFVSAQQIANGGFARLTLDADDVQAAQSAIRFADDLTLRVPQELQLLAPVIDAGGHRIALDASFIRSGSSNHPESAIPLVTTGSGQLAMNASLVELIGNSSLLNTEILTISGRESIRFRGVAFPSVDRGRLLGSLRIDADVTLRAGQIHPTTFSEFSVELPENSNRTLRLERFGDASDVLSVAGRLNFSAPYIEQAGALLAPFGQINLNAGESLLVAAGSLTSTSAAGRTIPFGLTERGQDWVYRIPKTRSTLLIDETPDAQIRFNAPGLKIAEGATVDISGGGDLQAVEFVPGPGGSFDVAATSNPEGAFAIVPSFNGEFAPYDELFSNGFRYTTGTRIALGGGDGLEAGVYTVLPARYAFLPGARLVTPRDGFDNLLPGQMDTLLDGTPVLPGRLVVAGTDIAESQWRGFSVETGARFGQRADYDTSLASSFFQPTVTDPLAMRRRLPADAGRLVFAVDDALEINGLFNTSASSAGGVGAVIDLASRNLRIVADKGSATAGVVQLTGAELQRLDAGSLLLGGTRENGEDSVDLTVVADTVTVESGVEVAAREVLLAGRDRVEVQSGASVSASGDSPSTGLPLQMQGDSALVRVSSNAQVGLNRTTGAAGAGEIRLEAGSVLSAAGGSIALSNTGALSMEGSLQTGGGSLRLGAPRISLGEVTGSESGLKLSNADLAALDASELILGSDSSIDLYGDLTLALDKLVLESGALLGFANDGKRVVISADSVTLGNAAGVAGAFSSSGNGELTVSSNRLQFSDGQFEIQGFKQVNFTGSQSIRGAGDTDLSLQASDVTLDTPLLTVSGGGNLSLLADGAVAVLNSGNVEPAAVDGLAAKLAIEASRIRVAGNIILPSGRVSLHAVGRDVGDSVNLENGAVIDVAGRDVLFVEDPNELTGFALPGGAVNLRSDAGDVTLAASATIDLTGGSAGVDGIEQVLGPNGELGLIAAQGLIHLDGTLINSTGSGGGRLVYDASSLDDLGGLSALATTAGLTGEQLIRARSGDLELLDGESILAKRVALTADSGAIALAGLVDASGEQAGEMGFWAQNDVTLTATGRLDASASKAGEAGGRVLFATSAGQVQLLSGGLIDISGAASGDGGKMHIRAARNGNLVNVGALDSRIDGAARVDIEAVSVYQASVIDNALVTAIETDHDNTVFTGLADTLLARLGRAGDNRFHVVAGVEVQNNGNISLDTPWDLVNFRPGGEAGVLTLRAAGDLLVDQNLSDGFRQVDVEDLFGDTVRLDRLENGPSWKYRLIAGADLGSSGSKATQTGTGNLKLAADRHIRTGAADIEIVAGNNIELTNTRSVIYSAGRATDPSRGESKPNGGMPDDFAALAFPAQFPVEGGRVSLTAQGDIRGARDDQMATEWLYRFGNWDPDSDNHADRLELATAWGINFDRFRQDVAAFGGGEVLIRAAGDIKDISVVTPSTGKPLVFDFSDNIVEIQKGGRFRVEANGDVLGGFFYAGDGGGELISHGALLASEADSIRPYFAIDSSGPFNVRVDGDLDIETILNPTVVRQHDEQPFVTQVGLNVTNFFFTYQPDSGASLLSVAGDVRLQDEQAHFDPLLGGPIGVPGDTNLMTVYPPRLSVAALSGDVIVNKEPGSPFTLFPSAKGHLRLLAGGSITNQGTGGLMKINLSDVSPLALPNMDVPQGGGNGFRELLAKFGVGPPAALSNIHAPRPVHLGDERPVLLVAKTGDIGGGSPFEFQSSKSLLAFAGRDIVDTGFRIQNVNPNDVSVIAAGRDIFYPDSRGPTGSIRPNTRLIEVSGPGRLDLLAGRNINLGSMQGLLSVGNQGIPPGIPGNPALADVGASLSLFAGLSQEPDYGGFIDTFFAGVPKYDVELRNYVERLTGDKLQSDAALQRFRGLPRRLQRELIVSVLLGEIREAGAKAAGSGLFEDYLPAYAAINTLFPGHVDVDADLKTATPTDKWQGDVQLFFSTIRTVDEGDINIFAPGGSVNVGLAVTTNSTKDPSQLGIVAQKLGDVSAVVRDNFLVNQSRVFALDGGDITLWTSTSNIDAGRGAKTAVSAPAPVTTTDADGNVTTVFSPATAGSGIQTAVSTPGRDAGAGFLFAPVGVVDFSDAGASFAGSLVVGAGQVLNQLNVDVAGPTVGVPAVDTASVAAGLTGVSSLASTTSKLAEQSATGMGETDAAALETKASLLLIEVLGLGDSEDREKREGLGDSEDRKKRK